MTNTIAVDPILDGIPTVSRSETGYSAREQSFWSFFNRSALCYIVAWIISWVTLFTAWPAPMEKTTAVPWLQRLHETLATSVLGLDPYYIPHVAFAFTILLGIIGGIVWTVVDKRRDNEVAVADGTALRLAMSSRPACSRTDCPCWCLSTCANPGRWTG